MGADSYTGEWHEWGSFDVEAMAVAPEGNKVWMFEKKQHWEDDVKMWPRIFESDDLAEALAAKRGSKADSLRSRCGRWARSQGLVRRPLRPGSGSAVLRTPFSEGRSSRTR